MSDLSEINGIGEKKIEHLKKLNINKISDILTYYPRDYQDRTMFCDINTVISGEKVCIVGILSSKSKSTKIRNGLEIAKIRIVSEQYSVDVNLFNQKYLVNSLKVGEVYLLYGPCQIFNGKLQMNAPSIEIFDENSPKILPIYHVTKGISQSDIRKICFYALKNTQIVEILPTEILEKYKLSEIKKALIQIHFPKTTNDIKQANRRISFEQLFLYTLQIEYLKNRREGDKGYVINSTDYSKLKIPFELTEAQIRSINECIVDMKSGKPMNRLLQGDVGSGKTIVALILSYIMANNSKQIAFMVPTEILANQHYQDFIDMGLNVALLTGSTTAKNKRIIKQALQEGSIDMVVGTHALITDDVEFKSLGLCIVDEQHRFGVIQRSKLLAKGNNPHLLVMSATPIPRTLALILYADLDLSIIDQMPKGRLPVKTLVLEESSRKKINSFIKKQIDLSKQVYIVCPLIEENETLDLKSATDYYESIKQIFCEYNVALIHGKMKASEKDSIMQSFKKGDTDILISTTVIEVGVNVPNATVMVIENAERFGLSALHQLRGRVGRSNEQSYCILVSNSKSERLMILEKTNDGFEVSKEDLAIRGSGDFFGTRQHGDFELVFCDVKILKYAHMEAKKILEKSPNLDDFPSLQNYINQKLLDKQNNIFN